MRLRALGLFLMLAAAPRLYSQQKPLIPPMPADTFFSDSGMGFDGHYNRCVWVCCNVRPRPGDTIHIVKLCGGMIGACPESYTLHHWNGNGWHVDISRNYRQRRRRKVAASIRSEALYLNAGRNSYILRPIDNPGRQFARYLFEKQPE
ncbi:MAG: hypothetical protein RLZZ370_1516 [Bacteroidota bacterium]|jgi:hypothetical protein